MDTPSQSPGQNYRYEDFIASIDRFSEYYSEDINEQYYFGFPTASILHSEVALLSREVRSTAYFSMEYGLAPSIYNSFQQKRPLSDKNKFFSHEVFSNSWLCDYLFKIQIDKLLDIPIYGGGLGVLAGDALKSSADLGFSVVALGVLWNKGYFKQNFWYKHGQVPEELTWDPCSYPGLIPLKNIVTLRTKQGPLSLRLWKYYVYSFDKKSACPLILLDSNLEQNSEHFRKLTDQLYRSDDVWWKIFQRSILGIGGMKALSSLGYQVDSYHLNEGHAAFAILEKYVSLADKGQMEEAKKKMVFTCHTPVAAGHDRFKLRDVANILEADYIQAAECFGKENPSSDEVNLTFMSLNNCAKVNAVSLKHGEIMRLQFPRFADKIYSITNGVHLHTWASDCFQKLFDQYAGTFGDWRRYPERLVQIENIEKDGAFRKDLFEAHQGNKRKLCRLLNRWGLKEDVFTLGWARRIAGYKRPALIFHNIEGILELAYNVGPLQIVMAGKAHPNDDIGGAHIDEILDHIDQLNAHQDVVKILILENYDTYFGKLLTSSVDVWLNNPLPPFEASGTSGMKAILNGVLQMSTLDGWIVEAASNDIGWIFGYQHTGGDIGSEKDLRLDEDSQSLCKTLKEAMQLYYNTYQAGELNVSSPWIDKMSHCVRTGAYFTTQRMMQQYKKAMWA
ncbi:MAG: alpha-glucan family phosphorylase [Candidatus Omnitrophota bacterium]